MDEGRKRCDGPSDCHGMELCVQVATGIAVNPFSTTQQRADTLGGNYVACGASPSITNQYGIPGADSNCFCLDLGLNDDNNRPLQMRMPHGGYTSGSTYERPAV